MRSKMLLISAVAVLLASTCGCEPGFFATLYYIYSIQPKPLRIKTKSLPDATAGSSYSVYLRAVGGEKPYSWHLLAGRLPNGLGLESDGLLHGVPTEDGVFTFVVVVRDSGGRSKSRSLSLRVEAPPTPLQITTSSLPAGYDGQRGYAATLEAVGGTGASYTWTIVSGTLPSNLSLDASTGVISGDLGDDASSSSPYQFTVEVTDGIETAMADLSVTVHTKLQITTTSLPDGYEGQSGYSATLTATGGAGLYVWSVTGGGLPPNLSLSGNGIVGDLADNAATGSPYAFTIEVTDGQQTVTAVLSITVYEKLRITTTSLPSAYDGQTGYLATLTATGGKVGTTLIWSLVSGSLPPNLNFDSSGLINGNITNDASNNSPYGFTVGVTDGMQTAQGNLSITVHA